MDDNAGQCRFIAYRNRYSPDHHTDQGRKLLNILKYKMNINYYKYNSIPYTNFVTSYN